MTNYFTQLPDDIITLLLEKLSIKDILMTCTTARVLNKFLIGQTIWQIVVERDYFKYLPAFSNFTNDQKWRQLFHHLSYRRIIPIYKKELLIGYLVIASTDSLENLHSFLRLNMGKLFLRPDLLPKTRGNLPIIDIYQPITNYHINSDEYGMVIVSTIDTQMPIYPRLYYRQDSVIAEFGNTSIYTGERWVPQDNKNVYPPNECRVYFKIDDKNLAQVSLNELFTKVYHRDSCHPGPYYKLPLPPINLISTIPSQYNLFNSIDRV